MTALALRQADVHDDEAIERAAQFEDIDAALLMLESLFQCAVEAERTGAGCIPDDRQARARWCLAVQRQLGSIRAQVDAAMTFGRDRLR